MRKARAAVRCYIAWNLQARPRTGPVVMREGNLLVDAEGGLHIVDWHLDFRYMTARSCDLWADLTSRGYPVRPAP